MTKRSQCGISLVEQAILSSKAKPLLHGQRSGSIRQTCSRLCQDLLEAFGQIFLPMESEDREFVWFHWPFSVRFQISNQWVISGLLFWSNHPRSVVRLIQGPHCLLFKDPPRRGKKRTANLANHQHRNWLGRKPPPSQLKCLWKGAALIASHPRNGASPQALSSTLRVKMTINQKIGDIHEYLGDIHEYLGDIHEYPSFRQTHTLEGRLGWLTV